MEQAGSRWRLAIEDGDEIEADLVIGADGVNSQARAAVAGEPPSYVGVTLIAGEIKHPLPGS
ncbi:hypothetical protein KQY30_33435 [Streptomyces sp. GMY02]|uniref:hypothetical protein n=1 Tax=Streptomyces sp. GMY02 TaxID=1333528 RepID=UPI001C2BAF7C|nr:hypothetical protein [Streptomyces sp. GMY02]QXE38409.1 hypothetical protein KQY30_33435 [Streptomyces sp. GMY02]